jgi:hypothetical protein
MAIARIQQIEEYVRQTMAGVAGSDLEIGHDFKHVDRVRRWALEIAEEEGYADLERVEAAALLHDADILDMLGAVGVMRAFTSKYTLPEHDPQNVKGETWEMAARDVDRRSTENKGIGEWMAARHWSHI